MTQREPRKMIAFFGDRIYKRNLVILSPTTKNTGLVKSWSFGCEMWSGVVVRLRVKGLHLSG